jgi:DNA modification methylase
MPKKPTPGPDLSYIAEGLRPLAVEIDKVSTLEKNPRKHDRKNLEVIRGSLERFGQQKPIVVNEHGVVIAGNGTLVAARRLGWTHVAASVSTLDGDEAVAFTVADNRASDTSTNDRGVLGDILGDLPSDLRLAAGYEPVDLIGLLKPEKEKEEMDPDAPATQDPDEPVVSVLGDIWIMGDHRLICGDAEDPDTVARVLGGGKPNLMVTDPPYGVRYKPEWREAALGGKVFAKGAVQNDDRADWRNAYALFPGEVVYVWHSGTRSAEFHISLEACDFIVRTQVVWVKERFAVSRGRFHHQAEPLFVGTKVAADDLADQPPPLPDPAHELAAYGVRRGGTDNWQGSRKESSVWFIKMVKNTTGHGTQKPVECMRRPMVLSSEAGEEVYDPFLGSGTTVIAGEMCGRRVRGCEIDPAYADIIVRRWEEFTGREAVHQDGRTFAEVQQVRLAELSA